jgi:hypothetical protein
VAAALETDKRHTPGAKAQCVQDVERPEAEASGYLEAKAAWKAEFLDSQPEVVRRFYGGIG